MKNSNILSATFLGIFAIVCFIGGFFTGEYATYDEKVIKQLITKNNEAQYIVQDMENFNNEVSKLNLLMRTQRMSSFDESIAILSKIVAKDVKRWEKHAVEEKYIVFSKIIEGNIKYAKTVLNGTNNR